MRFSLFLLLAYTLSAQPTLQCNAPPNWNATSGNVKSYARTDGPTFAQVAIYNPIATTGDPAKDSAADLKSVVAAQYTVRSTSRPVISNLSNGWSLAVASSEVSFPSTGNFTAVLHTFSGPTHRLTVLSTYNNDRYRPELTTFWQSLRPSDPTPTSPWTLNPEAESVRFTQGRSTVFVYYPITITDRLRQGDLVDAFWAYLVDPAFRTLNRTKLTPEAYSSTPTNFSSGRVVSNLGPHFAALVVLANNGVASAVLALTPDEASYRAAFPTPQDLANMIGRNRISLTANDLPGTWSTSNSTAMETYNANTGSYTGLAVAAVAARLELSANGTFRSQIRAYSGRLADLRSSNETDAGTFQFTADTLTLRSAKQNTLYDAVFIAVRGGRVLRLTNRQYPGMVYELMRQ